MRTKMCLAVLIGIFLICSGTSFVGAQESADEVVQPAVQELSGKIIAVNSEEGYISVQYASEGAEPTVSEAIFHFSSTLEIKKGNQVVEKTALAEGDEIEAQYSTGEDGNRVIQSLIVK